MTTVYPGYIRTGIHDAAQAERRRARGRRAGRAGRRRRAGARPRGARAPGARPGDDPPGTIQYFLARRSPRRLLDRITTLRVRRLARGGAFEPTGLAGELAARLSS